MACATLKRSLEFDPVHSHGRPSKRRRCVPMCVSPPASAQQSPSSSASTSAFGEIGQKLTPGKQHLVSEAEPGKMAANIREEIRRLHRRKQLNFSQINSDSSDMEGPASPSGPSCSSTYQRSSGSKEKPLFTFRQVELICERMLKEQEVKIREEYDEVLRIKLSEQYDTFVKFTYDQIQRKFESAAIPSYLS